MIFSSIHLSQVRLFISAATEEGRNPLVRVEQRHDIFSVKLTWLEHLSFDFNSCQLKLKIE